MQFLHPGPPSSVFCLGHGQAAGISRAGAVGGAGKRTPKQWAEWKIFPLNAQFHSYYGEGFFLPWPE
jgi:hypothetical protein